MDGWVGEWVNGYIDKDGQTDRSEELFMNCHIFYLII